MAMTIFPGKLNSILTERILIFGHGCAILLSGALALDADESPKAFRQEYRG
jgi:hypothetical protein